MTIDRRAHIAGLLAATVALTAAAVADAVSETVPSLVNVIGQAFIRAVPGTVSRFGIESAGSADKPLVVGGTVLIALLIGAAIGPLAHRRPAAGWVVFGAFGVLAVIGAASLEAVSITGTAIGAAAGVAAGGTALQLLLAAAIDVPRQEVRVLLPGAGVGRRRFMTVSAAAAGGTAVALTGAWGLRRKGVAERQRAGITLPIPAERASQRNTAGLDADGLSPLVTPNRDFYRIDEALVVPSVDVTGWRLRVGGMVDEPIEVTYDDLLAEPLIERYVTLACVSNEVGGELVGTARWLGVRLADVLDRARPHRGADQLVGRSVDGFTVGFPTEAARDGRDALVVIGMNDEPLPLEHGFPARLVVPGLYGYVSATKWLTEIELTTWNAFDAYWVVRGWAEEAPVKVQSRIDTPRDGRSIAPGTRAVAGVAWAPHRGIAKVELRVDDGEWTPARLSDALSDDAWRQWVVGWEATPGSHVLTVRATTGDGETQTDEVRPPFPDGASGLHEVTVAVA